MGVVILLVLLLSIIDDSFGYTAVVNQYDPEQLVTWVYEHEMLNAPNTTASEDDRELADGVAANPNAVGFFGYAYYLNQADELKAVAIDGVEPSQESVVSDEYPLARPLFIYSDASVMQAKPEVASFIDYYLRNVTPIIEDVGYFPAGDEQIEGGLRRACGRRVCPRRY